MEIWFVSSVSKVIILFCSLCFVCWLPVWTNSVNSGCPVVCSHWYLCWLLLLFQYIILFSLYFRASLPRSYLWIGIANFFPKSVLISRFPSFFLFICCRNCSFCGLLSAYDFPSGFCRFYPCAIIMLCLLYFHTFIARSRGLIRFRLNFLARLFYRLCCVLPWGWLECHLMS